jgi:hypothetical protein
MLAAEVLMLQSGPAVVKLEQNGGGAARVGLGGGADNLAQGGALEVKN